ncbi:hypothetical protein C2S52_008387 [Perilla frutescens var. hirtella]|uniref:Uncharacterized protein n=1 Tax=Perilla frutescens var. hirtella TaxID=608512 RepID=A0AAD4ISU2_PERFH|nr:hypothetical protein C2S51_017889 [Perilla frutescens var. frutescens]KAH6783428.1 hypothetical protein C2S52_008387 [Perilla frutescens var. hirtella]KAH6820491.1 hypothetical protein C2S53_008407 [Perilla frutescens var. hirtella]
MGNCIETLRGYCPETEKNRIDQEEEAKSEVEKGREKSNNVRIKIVLTKEELEWLMFQMQKSQGKKIEDVLGEIQRSRERTTAAWKPALDSIVESPEVLEGMDR